MKKKRMLLMLCLAVQTLFGSAEAQPYIVLHFKTGNNVYLKHEDKMKILFEDGLFSIGSSTYQLSEIRKYTFREIDPDSVDEVLINEKGIELVDGKLIIKSHEAMEMVRIFIADGVELPLTVTNDSDNNFVISLAGFENRMLVVKVGNESFKLQVR